MRMITKENAIDLLRNGPPWFASSWNGGPVSKGAAVDQFEKMGQEFLADGALLVYLSVDLCATYNLKTEMANFAYLPVPMIVSRCCSDKNGKTSAFSSESTAVVTNMRELAGDQISYDEVQRLYAVGGGFFVETWDSRHNIATSFVPVSRDKAKELIEVTGPYFWHPELTHGDLVSMGFDKRQAGQMMDDFISCWDEDADVPEVAEEIARKRQIARASGIFRS
ncbi:hypothetical protein BH09VER1_BH09VER1_26480 [soil metagenome]